MQEQGVYFLGAQPVECFCHSSAQAQSQEVWVEWASISIHPLKAEMKVMLLVFSGPQKKQ